MKLNELFQALRLAALGLLSLSLLSCGDEDALSKQIKVSISPASPIVINAGWTTTITDEEGNETEVSFAGPWLKFNYSIDNQSDRYLTIAGIGAKVRTFRFGREVVEEFTFQLPSGIPRHAVISPKTTETLIRDMFLYGLPASDSNSWSVELIFEGWYGTYQEPEKSYRRSFFFNANN